MNKPQMNAAPPQANLATRAAESGMPPATLAAILGHADLRSVHKLRHGRLFLAHCRDACAGVWLVRDAHRVAQALTEAVTNTLTGVRFVFPVHDGALATFAPIV